MTTHFKAPMSYTEIAERGVKMMDEGGHLVKVASILAEFEEATGRKLFVCEAEDRSAKPDLVFEVCGPGVAECLQGLSGIAFENAAQAEAEPIDTGSAETVTEPQVERQNDYTRDVDAQDAPVTAHAAEAPVRKTPVAPGVGRASFATGKPKAATKPTAEERPWGKLTLPEREIVKHLERLPKTFAPQDDLRLVELVASGNKIDTVAAFLEVEADAALSRWKSFLCEDVVGANGKPTIDGQKQLLNALRYRAETCQ